MTLGDSRRVDFSHSMVIMTSNLGAREMSELISGGIGFAPVKEGKNPNDTEVDQKIYRTAVEAARALGLIGDPAAAPALRSVLTHRDPYLSRIAFEALKRLDPSAATRQAGGKL